MLNHGGNLQKAKRQFPHFCQQWTDLSTGISPWSWPVPDIPQCMWQRLPEQTQSFDRAVFNYYECSDLIAVAGSQVAIEVLPQCLSRSIVALPRWGYGEHARSWAIMGHELIYYDSLEDINVLIDRIDHIVVINPNNPTGERFSISVLRQLQQQVKGYLIVDEAFIDSHIVAQRIVDKKESVSMLPYINDGALIVLRSMGKFFGLAGIRLGFVGLPSSLRARFSQRLHLWSISSPTFWLAEKALMDVTWQQMQCQRIQVQSNFLFNLTHKYIKSVSINADSLFVSIKGTRAELKNIFECFAHQGVLLRLFEPRDHSNMTYLRIGLPKEIKIIAHVFSRYINRVGMFNSL